MSDTTKLALEPVATGLKLPVGFAIAPGDPAKRIFVVEKDGLVAVLERGSRDGKLVRSPTPFLDLRRRVGRNHDEQGLLGIAFHPRFQQKPLVYVNFTNEAGDTEISQFRAASPDAPAVDPDQEAPMMQTPQPFSNHNGGHLLFGPDGKLWIGLGDGGKRYDPHGNAQNPTAVLGKMLRYDVDHACDCALDKHCDRCTDGKPKSEMEVVALGLRNPWKYAFDRETNALYIADVGQDRWEEISVLPVPAFDAKPPPNFGWAKMEGNHCASGLVCDDTGLVPAVLEYDHDTGCSITGGFVYRGKELPELAGQYFYSDYCTAILRSLTWKDGKVVATADYKAAIDPQNQLAKVSTFGEDHDGEMYIVSEEGTIWKVVRGR